MSNNKDVDYEDDCTAHVHTLSDGPFGMCRKGFFLFTRNRIGALLLSGLVLSHWVLDLIVHIPDLPLYPGQSPKVGFGLWNSPFLTVLIEGTIFIVGIALYINTKKVKNQRVTWKFWSLVAFLMVIFE